MKWSFQNIKWIYMSHVKYTLSLLNFCKMSNPKSIQKLPQKYLSRVKNKWSVYTTSTIWSNHFQVCPFTTQEKKQTERSQQPTTFSRENSIYIHSKRKRKDVSDYFFRFFFHLFLCNKSSSSRSASFAINKLSLFSSGSFYFFFFPPTTQLDQIGSQKKITSYVSYSRSWFGHIFLLSFFLFHFQQGKLFM